MKRGAYVGDAGVLSGNGQPNIPIQSETVAYFSRFSSPPSVAYRNAVNHFIHRCKRDSIWNLIQDLWLFPADTQADSLRNLISASRDATITGTPTFTANRGFSALTTSNYVSLPFSTTNMVTGSGVVAAGQFDANPLGVDYRICGEANKLGGFKYIWGGGNGLLTGNLTNGSNANLTTFYNVGLNNFVLGQWNTNRAMTAGMTGLQNTSGTGVTASPLLVNNADGSPNVLKRLCAYAFLPAPGSDVAMRKLLSHLTGLLDDVGALD